MNVRLRSALCAGAALLWCTTAGAQTPAGSAQPHASSTSTETRPATTTFSGDTGLWYVPTAEVLAQGRWSVSAYRSAVNDRQGFSNLSEFAGTFAVGVKDRLELFGSITVDRRIDRDIRPLFTTDTTVGGVLAAAPFATSGWSGDHFGDVYLGAKVNLLSEARRHPVAFALRGIVKIPTASKTNVGTGKADVSIDAVISKEVTPSVELAAYGGAIFRSNPSGMTLSNGFRWGGGAEFPSRTPLRLITEVHGEVPFDKTLTVTTPLVASDGSLSPLSSVIDRTTTATIGAVWQARNGFFIGGGINWNLPTADRANYTTDQNVGTARDFIDYQVRIGFHPGAPIYVAPPPPPQPPPPPPPANRPPTVRASCDPCTVNVGQAATVSAAAQDPDGDTLTYQWTAPAGTLADATAASTKWTAPDQEGPVQITVTVNDGKGGTASDTTTIQVTRPPKKVYTFEDVHFEFDQYSLAPAAIRILDEVVKAMQEDPTLKLQVQGYTCNIGTPEYNLALGDRRAKAVQEYLISRGIDASRLSTVSFGEENPKYSNEREETRRLNRRAALEVRLVQ
ncbi:MAG: OmpA family protein [Acidobacteriota bacterium]|nr:OmpA family protein [Acidobacteriota bacterium]